MRLSPQQAVIVEKLRSMDWVCSSEFGYIKDDRRRITDLNRGYMKEKGFEIVGRPCDGRCGKDHSSGLFMRRAQKRREIPNTFNETRNKVLLSYFDSYDRETIQDKA